MGALTSTVTVQVLLAAMVPPLNAIDAAPATGVNVGAPQPLVVAFGTGATTMLPGAIGNVSLKATPVSAFDGLMLVSVKVSVETPPAPIGLGANAFAMVGTSSTVSVAFTPPVFMVAVAPLMLPEVLAYEPPSAEVTLTAMVQLACAAASDPPASAIDPDAAVAVTAPPQLFTSPFGVATT